MGDKGTETKTDLKFTPEATQVLGDELSAFIETYLPKERLAQRSLLDALSANGPLDRRTVPGLESARKITSNALQGAAEGVTTRDRGDIRTALENQQGDLAEAFRQLALQTAARQQSVVDPRFASLLFPTTSSRTAPTSTQQAVDAVKAVLTIAAAAT